MEQRFESYYNYCNLFNYILSEFLGSVYVTSFFYCERENKDNLYTGVGLINLECYPTHAQNNVGGCLAELFCPADTFMFNPPHPLTHTESNGGN